MSLVLEILDGTEDLSRFKHSLAINDAIVGKNIKMKGSGTGIVVADKTSIQNIFATGGTFAGWIHKISKGEGNYGRAWSKNRHELYVANSETLMTFKQRFSGVDGTWNITTLGLGLWQRLVITYDASSDSNAPLAYVNGEIASVAVGVAPEGTYTSDIGTDLDIVWTAAVARAWDGMLSDLKFITKIKSANWAKEDYERTEKFY